MLTTSNICDPDGVLDVASRNRLDYELKQLERRTSQVDYILELIFCFVYRTEDVISVRRRE